MVLSSPKIEKVFIFSQKKLFTYFVKRNVFKTIIFLEGNFLSSKKKQLNLKKIILFCENGTFQPKA